MFNREEVDKYTWVDIGSSYLPSDLLAAFLYAQLEKLDEIQNMRMNIWNSYYSTLKPFEEEGKVRLPIIPEYAEHNAHLFYILLETEDKRDNVMNQLKKEGIHAVFHYVPLHSAPMGLRFGNKRDDLPVTEEMSKRLLRIPIFAGMTIKEKDFLSKTIIKLLEGLNH